MKRTQDKIKDIVEPQDFDEVRNLAADPARSLAAYRFTDATSDLLARLLDELADLPRGRGAARALAGPRGVGKSHTLAVFGALAGQEKLRRETPDAHVATSARRLSGRRYMVVRVERGTRATLAEEMAAAFGKAFGGSEVQWGTNPAEMVAVAGTRAVDSTLVLVVDTGFDRPLRVRRDDGPALGDIARAARGTNAFVALALDDDISGADGPNVAIAGTYHIDYLDHEHLFRIVDTYILRKNDQARAAIHDIYLHLRACVPGFNWSEPRFASLYPVHPLIADVSAAVRLYAPTFAFLPFAAEAARRAVSRPALSLVLLDEVFDRVERDLRHSAELKEAFETYDDLAARAVGQFPVMQRLEARLVLKSLFVLSLDGAGTTPGGLCAALLVADETDPQKAAARMKETLDRFAAAAPDAVRVSEGGTRYRLQISASDKFQAALERSVESLPVESETAALELLRAAARSRFEDWPFAAETDARAAGQTGASVVGLLWRGSERRGRLVWQQVGAELPSAAGHDCEVEVRVGAPLAAGQEAAEGTAVAAEDKNAAPLAYAWRPAAVTHEELQTLMRLLALRTDGRLVGSFVEAARAAETALLAQAERVWARIYLDEGVLESEGGARRFNDRARAARTLAESLSEAVAEEFAARYPQHPEFAETFAERDAERLAAGLFAGGAKADADVQRLARLFALPLGLVEQRGEEFMPAPADAERDGAWTKETIRLVESSAAEGAPLEAIRAALAAQPYGLGRAAQNLILAALVSQRRIDLVTKSGERAGRAALADSFKWEAFERAAVTGADGIDPEDLAAWARRLTRRADLPPLTGRAGRESARAALAEWLAEWESLRLSGRFESLADAALTTRVWKMETNVRRRFGAAAEAVRAHAGGEATLEECLERVAESFDDSHERHAEASRDFDALAQYVEHYATRAHARAYLTAAEPTGVDEVEIARRELLAIAGDRDALFDAALNERFKRLWTEFRARYSEHYAAAHDALNGPGAGRRALDALLMSDRWREFETLSRLPFVGGRHLRAARELLRRAEAPRCELPVRELLAAQPACACAFSLARADAQASLPRELSELCEMGLKSYRRTLALLARPLADALDALAAGEEARRDVAMHARILAAAFRKGALPLRFSRADAQLVERAAQEMGDPAPVRVAPPTEGCGLVTREELEARLGQWLDELPSGAALVELATGSETHV